MFRSYEMFRMGESIETESRCVTAWCWAKGGSELLLNRYEGSFRDNGNVLEPDGGDGCAEHYEYTKYTELSTLKYIQW